MLYSLIIIDLKINSEYHLQIEKKIGKISDLETDTEHEILYHIQTAMLAPSCLLKHIFMTTWSLYANRKMDNVYGLTTAHQDWRAPEHHETSVVLGTCLKHEAFKIISWQERTD